MRTAENQLTKLRPQSIKRMTNAAKEFCLNAKDGNVSTNAPIAPPDNYQILHAILNSNINECLNLESSGMIRRNLRWDVCIS
ncbi:MAG: hypothetical protein ACTS4X_01105 [Candidatus Hodgkinia cicadicola]